MSAPDLADDTRAILRRVREGDVEAFEALYQRYHQFILASFMGLGFSYEESWDLMQESFLHALRGMDTLDLERPVYFGGWMSTIARNVARRRWSRPGYAGTGQVDDSGLLDIPDIASDAPDDVDTDHTALGQCLDTLDARMRAIVVAKYLLGSSFRQIGPLVGCSEATVRNRLAEALELLATCLQAKGVLPPE